MSMRPTGMQAPSPASGQRQDWQEQTKMREEPWPQLVKLGRCQTRPVYLSAWATMVFYYSIRGGQCLNDSKHITLSSDDIICYVGRDKHENEHLIKYGWPGDIWFHVEGKVG